MKPTSESDTKMEFESVLYGEIGHFGKYQIINILLLALPAIVSGFMAGEYIFSASRLPHRCLIPECDGDSPEFRPTWIYDAIPSTSSGFDECQRFAINLTFQEELPVEAFCHRNIFNRNVTLSCDKYVYLRTNSVVYDFNLECEEWLRALAGTLNSMGAMIALPLAGFISDRYGRRASIMFFSFNLALVGFVRSFSINYAMYAALQFMQTAIGGGTFSAAYILATEIVGPKFRVITSATMSSMFALGQVLLGVIASQIYEWRRLSLVLFTPAFLLVAYKWLVTESPRWLLTKNRQDQAKTTVNQAATLNGRNISDKTMSYLIHAIPEQIQLSTKNKNVDNLFMKVFKSPTMLRRCCTTPVLWITTTFIYYGLSINSVSLSGNMYWNYIAIAAIEIPGFWTAVLVLNRIGRKTTLFMGYTACGICCVGFAFTPKGMYALSLILFLAGKYFIGLVMTSLYLYTAELYPTRHRHSFLGFSSMLGRIGSVISPLTPPLMDYWSGIPSMMFGSMAVISALLVLTQPETLKMKVPDTFEDAEQLGKCKG
ncbi:unnamed protein product [Chilo suppressalis]|uniref:Major facilitator superfamily (MFS) profile domain-containing protein n=1 Tax=Chilo suppressalis TaxID=168631 RepID=A0ABN8APR8_CHISP|nr:unnamed protein product [Chilo suppressalis]